MKQIFIASQFSQFPQSTRGLVKLSISDFLYSKGFLATTFFPSTQVFEYSKLKLELNFVLKSCQGIILQGGENVSSLPDNLENQQVFSRDFFEYLLLEIALEKKIGVFGICRGLQLINKYYGGTLKYFKDHHKKYDTNFKNIDNMDLGYTHSLYLKGEFFKSFYPTNYTKVNSAHEQGIDILGKGLALEAVDENNEIEAVSDLKNKIVAVQWHLEANFKDVFSQKTMQSWLSLL